MKTISRIIVFYFCMHTLAMETREKIIEAAGKLFIENGIKQITMDTIAQSMGISKRTIYENFIDKNELLTSVLIDSTAKHKQKALEIMNSSKNIIEALFNFGVYNHRLLKQIHPNFFNDIKKYHCDVFSTIMKNGENSNNEISYSILKRGVDEGIFSEEIDLEIASYFINHTMEFFHKIEDKNFDTQKIWKSVHLPYLVGICTPKGQELVKRFREQTKIS
jgi:TetR/AcrR family transcriptional regulator, cholesterol catabolism regulator